MKTSVRRQPPGIAVFFVTHLTPPLSSKQIQTILQPLGASLVKRARRNLEQLGRRHPGMAVITVRELFAGAESAIRVQALTLFRSAGLARLCGEAAVARTAPTQKAKYLGPFPDQCPAAQARWYFLRMREIQQTAADVVAENLSVSPSHIVISARRGSFLTITATDTDKAQVHLYSQTPLATVRRGRVCYYGDEAYPPSTETLSHWYLHQALQAQAPANGIVLVHFHHAGLRDAVPAGQVLKLGTLKIPCIAPGNYGSREQGEAVARAMLQARAQAVTIANHGTWFAGSSFAAAMKLARRAVRLQAITR